MSIGRASVLAPTNAPGGIEVLPNNLSAFLEMVDALFPVTPLHLFLQNLGSLDAYPFLSHKVFPVLQKCHWICIRVLRIKVVRRTFIILYFTLENHLTGLFETNQLG
jgi:hypothetical protein